MAFEELKAQIGMLLGEMNEQPEDLHELYQQIHQELNQLRATGSGASARPAGTGTRLLKSFPWRRRPEAIRGTPHLHPRKIAAKAPKQETWPSG
jgi:hypothetical protein